MTDINEILKEHVSLDIECIDRIYLNGYIPTMQMGGQLVKFIQHRGYEIPSPAILRQWTDAYKKAVERFAQAQGIELIHFEKGARKGDVAAKYRAEFAGEEGVLFIGIAQERAYAFQGRKKTKQKLVGFEYSRQSVFVNHYYFYLQDKEFGPAFIKVCSYAPYGLKICLNGHEWAKRQARKQGLSFEALDNGFLSCQESTKLQEICDQLGPEQIQAFFEKWQARLPWRLQPGDQQAGYRYRLSV